jgi:hypothetical protein
MLIQSSSQFLQCGHNNNLNLLFLKKQRFLSNGYLEIWSAVDVEVKLHAFLIVKEIKVESKSW